MSKNIAKLRKAISTATGTNDNMRHKGLIIVWVALGILIGVVVERNATHQEINGDQNIQVANAGSIHINQIDNSPYADWGDLTGSTRDIYRSEMFAYFPWVLGPMKANDWTKIQDWLREQRGIENTNIRDIVRSRRNGAMPRQVATFLYSYENSLTYVLTETSAHLTATWHQDASRDLNVRQSVWQKIIIDAILKAHGKKWASVIKEQFNND